MVNKITDYLVIQSSGSTTLTALINNRIIDGWQPLGGTSINGSQYVQAVVKYDTDQADQVTDQINDIHSFMVIDLPAAVSNWNDHMSYPRMVKIEKG
jgi:alcohol dehydrogenase YqhD (iron-dependent ADH family)